MTPDPAPRTACPHCGQEKDIPLCFYYPDGKAVKRRDSCYERELAAARERIGALETKEARATEMWAHWQTKATVVAGKLYEFEKVDWNLVMQHCTEARERAARLEGVLRASITQLDDMGAIASSTENSEATYVLRELGEKAWALSAAAREALAAGGGQ